MNHFDRFPEMEHVGGLYLPSRRLVRRRLDSRRWLIPGVVAGGHSTSSNGLLANLVAYWKMDESSGNPADATGNGHTLTNVGSAGTFVAAKINNGFNVVSASSAYASDTGHAVMTGAKAAITVSCWMNRAASNKIMTFGWYDDSSNKASLAWYSDGNIYAFAGNSSTNFVTFANTDTGWHHFLYVYDGSQGTSNNRVKVYYDGALLTGGTYSGTFPTTYTITGNFTLGALSATAVSDGTFDEAGVWNSALTAANDTSLYNSGSGLAYGSFS